MYFVIRYFQNIFEFVINSCTMLNRFTFCWNDKFGWPLIINFIIEISLLMLMLSKSRVGSIFRSKRSLAVVCLGHPMT